MNKKVYVSSGFYKNENPNDTLKTFIKNNINTIELSGGSYIDQKQIEFNINDNSRNLNWYWNYLFNISVV